MRWLSHKIFLFLFILLFIYVPVFFPAADFQTTWVKRVVDGDTLLLISGERMRLIEVDTVNCDDSADY